MPAEKPWSKHIPEGAWDYVVIGSGMGGMTAAAFLAKLGKRVLVLEQHYEPGGFTHTFRRHQWRWDVGVHAVGEVTDHSLPGRLLSYLTDGGLKWASLGAVYEHFHYPGGFQLDFPDNPRAFRDSLVEAFPDEEAAIDGYLELVREIAGSMRGYYLSKLAPAGLASRAARRFLGRRAREMFQRRSADVIAELTQDPKLRALMVAQWGYYGAPPSQSSFAAQALVTKHFQWGGYYPVGGSARIAHELLRTVKDAGGWTVIRADVDEIVLEGGKVSGVRLTDGRQVASRRVVSAAGVTSTVTRMLPGAARDADWVRQAAELRPGPAHVCLYLGFEGDIRAAGASGANEWFYESWDTDGDCWHVPAEGDPGQAPVLYCSFPSLKDPEHDPGPRVLHTGEVVTFVPWELFEPWIDERWRKRGEAYDALKTRVHEAMLEQFLGHMPGLRPLLKFAELSTPISTHHFVRPMHGSIYGPYASPDRFELDHLRPRSPIRGLYFAGSDLVMGGVVAAAMGGALGAVAAEPIAAAAVMRRIARRPG